MTRDNPPNNRDEWLASFADQVLAGQTDALPMEGSDSELRALADTILRLERAYPKREPESVMLKRIQAGVLVRWRSEEQKKARWLGFLRMDWFARVLRPQYAMALAVIAMIGILIVAAPNLSTSGGLPGAAEIPSSVTWLLFGILLVVAFWFIRRNKK